MTTVFFALIIVLLSVGGLSIGVLFGRAPLRGTCGGLAVLGACEACPKPCKEHG